MQIVVNGLNELILRDFSKLHVFTVGFHMIKKKTLIASCSCVVVSHWLGIELH